MSQFAVREVRTYSRSVWTREIARARKAEQNRRNATAKRIAYQDLAARYFIEFEELYAQARREVHEKEGPLPGDEDDQGS